MEVQTQLQTARSGFPTDHEALTNNLLDVADTCMAMMTRAYFLVRRAYRAVK
jgi:hypothetical protein